MRVEVGLHWGNPQCKDEEEKDTFARPLVRFECV